MKHKFLFIAIVFTGSLSVAKAQTFEKGTNVASAGIGIGSSIGSFTYGSQTPGISINYEKGLWNAGDDGIISIGGYLGYKSYKDDYADYSYNYSEKWSYTIIGVRSAYHYTALHSDNFDLYGGLMLSYNILSYKYSSTNPYDNYQYSGSYGSTVGITGFIGGRYYFNSSLAANAEIGYGASYLTLGVSLKL